MPTYTSTDVQEQTWAGPDGSRMGQSTTDKIAFYGSTPIVQRAAGSNAVLTTGSTTTAQTAVLIEIQATLVALGLMPAT